MVDAKHYIVDGFATWMDGGDLGLFLDRNLLKDGSSVKMSFSESGNVYEGTIKVLPSRIHASSGHSRPAC